MRRLILPLSLGIVWWSAGCQQHGMANRREHPMPPPSETGFEIARVEVHGAPYPVAIRVPRNYSDNQSWPVILFLHGKGECGDDGVFHTTVGLGRHVRAHPERFPAIVVMPQIPVGSRWEGARLDLALAALDEARRRYHTDPGRVVLTGLSLGGFGVWALGARCPERFCALVPICGGGDPANARHLARVPIWCFHGAADPVIPVERSRTMTAAVRAAGGSVKYTELPGVGHNSWDAAYGDPEVIRWMLAQHRRTGSDLPAQRR